MQAFSGKKIYAQPSVFHPGKGLGYPLYLFDYNILSISYLSFLLKDKFFTRNVRYELSPFLLPAVL